MPRKRFMQSTGLLELPDGTDKFFVTWTIDNIISGFKHFHELNGRWPKAIDLDKCNYLPTARSLERKFGGIVKVRQLLGVTEPDFGKGKSRSNIAKLIGKRGFNFESYLEELLIKTFHEPYVHNQSRMKILSKSGREVSVNLDFLIYEKNGKFGIDAYYPSENKLNFINNTRMKLDQYKNTEIKIFLVVGNEKVDDELIVFANKLARTVSGGQLISVYKYTEFINTLSRYEPLKNPY